MIEVAIDAQPIYRAIQSFLDLSTNPTQALVKVGDQVQEIIDERFQKQVDADGVPWKPLSPKYLAAKTKAGYPALILTRTGALKRSIRYQIEGETIVFSSDTEYAAKVSEDRPFLGLSTSDVDQLGTTVLDVLATKLKI